MEKSYQEIGKEAKLVGAEDPNVDELQSVKEWLEGESSGNWAVVIDNADDENLFLEKIKVEANEPPDPPTS